MAARAGHKLADLIDIGQLQRLCDGLFESGGIGLGVLEPDGTVLVSSGWQDICALFHRHNEVTRRACLESDLRVNRYLADNPEHSSHYAYTCPHGLIDLAFPLVVNGAHVANLISGQFFFDDDIVDVESFRERALRVGFDQAAYLDALARVPRITHQRAEQTIRFMAQFVRMLAELGVGALERQRAHEALRISRQQYETFLNATNDIAFLKDDDLRYVIVNEANARFFGKSVQEVVGCTDADLMPPEAARSCRDSDAQALAQRRMVVSCETVDGRVYETRKFPVRLDSQRFGVGGYVRDITEQRAAEEQIAALNRDLEQRVAARTVELEAVNRELESFVYSVSHDLRAPLRGIDGFSQILLEDYGELLDDAGRAHLARIRLADQKMDVLIDGLLKLSRLSRCELQLRWVDLSEVAQEIAASLQATDPSRCVDFVIPDGLRAWADLALINIVLENLLGNAWRFTGKNDAARIEVGATSAGGPGFAEEVDAGANNAGAPLGHAERAFFVRDDGAGFDMTYADKLFGAFQRLHTPGQFEGTGIGLATVQRIIRRHGGRVWAAGEVEVGATFSFTLPEPMGRRRVGGGV